MINEEMLDALYAVLPYLDDIDKSGYDDGVIDRLKKKVKSAIDMAEAVTSTRTKSHI